MEWFIVFGSIGWIGLLLLPWRPWGVCERLEVTGFASLIDFVKITVLIPARNEEENVERTLCALRDQGEDLKIFLIDDQSIDHTKEKAQAVGLRNLTIVDGRELPDGWTGKLWALEQGRKLVTSSLLLLLDADIELAPGMVAALHKKLVCEKNLPKNERFSEMALPRGEEVELAVYRGAEATHEPSVLPFRTTI
jgi:glycosyltransferase involved in cell wall biosynthesis